MSVNIWAVNSLGGYMYSDNLSANLRMAVQPQVKYRQFCDVKDASQQGLSKGDTYHWNVYSDIATAGTTLQENQVMPESNFTITQGSLTVTEYGNSVPYTGKLDALSEHPVNEIVNKVLKNDATKAFDTAAHAEFDKTPLRICANGATAVDTLDVDGTVTGTNDSALRKAHVVLISDIMKERNIPGYSGDDYYCIAKPTTLSTLKTDLESIHQYTDTGLGMIMNGEIGRYRNTRFVEQTYIADTGTWGGGLSGDAYFFGEDTCAEAIAIPEEMRGKIPTDFGRSKGVAWYYLGGFGLVHTTAMGHAQARIVKWDSAA
jgi:N4-gp56 family major capsid protein